MEMPYFHSENKHLLSLLFSCKPFEVMCSYSFCDVVKMEITRWWFFCAHAEHLSSFVLSTPLHETGRNSKSYRYSVAWNLYKPSPPINWSIKVAIESFIKEGPRKLHLKHEIYIFDCFGKRYKGKLRNTLSFLNQY